MNKIQNQRLKESRLRRLCIQDQLKGKVTPSECIMCGFKLKAHVVSRLQQCLEKLLVKLDLVDTLIAS